MNKAKTVYQVSDLLNEMRRLMEVSYPEIWIEGELSSLSAPASGHLYFSLKDEQSQLRCAMFRNRASISRYQPKAGDLVRVRAKISVYTARGDLQCIVQHIEEAGEGILQKRFEELKQKLNQQGLFDSNHKQSLPSFAQRIGIITSPTGAAVKDVLSTLNRRCPGIPVTIYPAVVQGESAPESIIGAIKNANQHQQCDVLILTRGGGSLEDLWCFNDERLANEIFNCAIPIVSGVGHEVDFTIADLVADQRAPTPTAAAELLSPDNNQLQAQLQSLWFRLTNGGNRLIQQQAQRVDHTFQLLVHPKEQLHLKFERLQQQAKNLSRVSRQSLQHRLIKSNQMRQRFKALSLNKRIEQSRRSNRSLNDRLQLSMQQNLKSFQQQTTSASQTLNAVSPLATLDRGFSITRDKQKQILRDSEQVKINQSINVQLKSGTLECTVDVVKK
ncbi:MAG: exodeoxyribonuclease VII large subunit [Acidiferrobacterales bacterium]|nr:exodeoxyribonuclease VII large subunit [Acidiferrobacterales bacterium]